MTAFRRILVGWDCSPGAAAALRAAASPAADGTVRVVALAVLKPASHAESREEGTAGLNARRGHAMKAFAEARDALARERRARVSLHVAESGGAARTVCEYARQHGFDLLAPGRHGIGGIPHPRLGHVTATAAKTGSMPVLVAPWVPAWTFHQPALSTRLPLARASAAAALEPRRHWTGRRSAAPGPSPRYPANLLARTGFPPHAPEVLPVAGDELDDL